MVLEATMIVLDNSEYMRNGDYLNTRYEAQIDAVEVIFSAKTHANPENTVGVMSMAGAGPKVLSTLTSDHGRILSGLHEACIEGKIHLTTGIQVAGLALKHRQNKVQNQRIIVFVGSPIEESDKDLEKLAKKMKKNNVAIDFISFGEVEENADKLSKFINVVNNRDNSHLVTVPVGPQLLYEAVAQSPIIREDGGEGFSGMGGEGDLFEFGADPNLDPELALALRLSLEEEKARQAKLNEEQKEPMEKIEEEGTSKDDKQ